MAASAPRDKDVLEAPSDDSSHYFPDVSSTQLLPATPLSPGTFSLSRKVRESITMETGVKLTMSRWKPVFRQPFRRNVLTFTLASALTMLAEICLSVFIVTQITALEREFGFTTLQSGRLLSASEIGFLCFVIPSGYLAARLHVPRTMAIATVCFGLTGIMSGLPHFLFRFNHHNSTVISVANIPPTFCHTGSAGEGGERCEAAVAVRYRNVSSPGAQTRPEVVFSEMAQPVFIYLLIFQVIRGITGAPRFPMFAAYIETNAKQTDSGFYIGIVAAIAMLGPAIAFLGGGAISKLHVSLQATDLTPNHPQWVGAWWLGFLVFGSLAALSPVFLWSFPRRFAQLSPVSSELAPTYPSELAQAYSSELAPTYPSELAQAYSSELAPAYPVSKRSCKTMFWEGVAEVKAFAMSILRLLLNPVLMCLVVGSCLFSFSMNGLYLFMPKYLQNQFQLPAFKANYIMGCMELISGTSGFLLGGWLTRRLKLNISTLYKLAIASTFFGLLIVVVLMFIGCPQAELAGTPSAARDTNNCTLSCACPDEVFPVCDRESRTNYYSPCHAGCSYLSNGVYMNCSCTASGQVYPGLCSSDCSALYYFCVLFYILMFVLSVGGPMHYLLLVRCVPTSQTGLTMGVNNFATGMVGLLIGPIVFGGLIDSFCQHWKMACEIKGQCSVYDNDRFRKQMYLYIIWALSLAVLLYSCSAVLHFKLVVQRLAPHIVGTTSDDEQTAEKEMNNRRAVEMPETGLFQRDDIVESSGPEKSFVAVEASLPEVPGCSAKQGDDSTRSKETSQREKK